MLIFGKENHTIEIGCASIIWCDRVHFFHPFSWQVLNHLLYMMRATDRAVQRRVALALAHLCAPDDCKTIFIDNNGIYA